MPVPAGNNMPLNTPSLGRAGTTAQPPRPSPATGARDDRYALEVRIQHLELELDGRRKTIAKLESEGIQHLRTISDLRSEDDVRHAQQQYHHKREMEADRERVRILSAELASEREKTSQFESRSQQMGHDLIRVPILEARATELEANLKDSRLDAEEQKRQRSALEFKILEMQSTSQTRLLEGKIAMLSQMLEERVTDVVEEQKRTHSANMKIEDLKTVLADMQRRTSALEREKGEASVLLDQRNKEFERADERLRHMGLEAEDMLARLLAAEHHKEELVMQQETAINDVRNDMRGKVRQVSNLEIERAQLNDRVAEGVAALARDKLEFERLGREVSDAKEETSEARRRVEEWQSSSARDSVALKGLKEETDRLRRCIEDKRLEATDHEEQRSRLEQRTHELEQDVRRKGALEEQVDGWMDSLSLEGEPFGS